MTDRHNNRGQGRVACPARRILLYLWAAPGSFLGLILMVAAVRQGGTIRMIDGVLEVHGGIVTRLLAVGLPWVGPTSAITLGHVVLGRDAASLDRTRPHERIHVRQYELWGPMFIPLYLLSSLWACLRGKDPYRDNAFEREAFAGAAREA